jgi:CheY-like chemotaxis protein
MSHAVIERLEDTNVLTILVVDDEPSLLSATQTLLTLNGFRALVARDGAEAFQIASAEFPHLILTDWMMPRMDGLELCLRLRHYYVLRQIKILLTSSAGKPLIYPPLWDEFRQKPMFFSELLPLLNNLLEGQAPRLPANSASIRESNFRWAPLPSRIPF